MNEPIHAGSLLSAIAEKLSDNGLDDRRRDARLLLALALNRIEPVLPHENISVTQDQKSALEKLIERRNDGEPIARIRGYREFYSLDFKISPATLDPRADSETLVDAALSWINQHQASSLSILDFGTGSGCLLLAILANARNAHGLGVDIQKDAIDIAQQNAKNLGLMDRATFMTSSWDENLDPMQSGEDGFDLIISNPPYIPHSDIAGLMPEVQKYDPMLALDGGENGLDAWAALAPIMSKRLKPEGAIFVEIGAGQEHDVCSLFDQSHLQHFGNWADLSGMTRCLGFRHKKKSM